MEANIAHNDKDILQKYASALFRNKTLEFYGIKSAKIVELINVELPNVEVSEQATDTVFLLEDGTYLHLEFQTTHSRKDLLRFMVYDARLYGRDERIINTVVVYSSDVKTASKSINIGSAVYSVDTVMMGERDGNAVYADLEKKFKNGAEITDNDIQNLIFLPLMKSTIPKDDIALQAADLAQTITDSEKRDLCIAAVIAFGEKYLKKATIRKLMEVLEMGSAVAEYLEERFAEREEKAEEKAFEKMAKNALRKGITIDVISEITGLDLSVIKRLQSELLTTNNI
ncbi:hypothetical protein AGMMS49975_24840 [Clostridia bacterium]|nr:hypothetical protein AGMMS49975_24840 [Clostridia bacterium]